MAGTPHAFEDFRQQVRQRLLGSGYDEVINRKGWAETVTALSKRSSLPLRLFTPDGPSAAFADKTVSDDTNRRVVGDVAKALGFADFIIRKNSVYVERGGKSTRIAETEMLLPDSTAQLRYPTFVVTADLEGAAMARYGHKSRKELLYPHLSESFDLDDKRIAAMIRMQRMPKTGLGKAIADAIVANAERYGTKPSPTRYRVYQRNVGGKRLEVWLINPRSGVLCGKNFLDEVYVRNGDVLSGPPADAQNAVRTRIRFLDAFANHAASEIEQLRSDYDVIAVETARKPGDANILIPEIVENFAKASNKKIAVAGDVGIRIEAKLTSA